MLKYKKTQFAMEHIAMIGFGILIIIPMVYLFSTNSLSQSEELITKQIEQIGNKITDNAETIYYMGTPSKITLEEMFPDKIVDIEIVNNEQLVFYYSDKNSSRPFLSNVPIDGIYYEKTGDYCEDNDVWMGACTAAGLKKITLKAEENNVSIIFR